MKITHEVIGGFTDVKHLYVYISFVHPNRQYPPFDIIMNDRRVMVSTTAKQEDLDAIKLYFRGAAGGGRMKRAASKKPRWTSTGRKATLKDGTVRTLYRGPGGELRVRRIRQGKTIYVKP